MVREEAQQQEEQRGGWNLGRIGVLAVVIGVVAWLWQAWFGSSVGVVHKADPIYDFIIVGGGTAGSVIAARLSEEPEYKVLLIEAGGEEPWLSKIPLASPLLQKSRFDWQYLSVPQELSSQGLINKQSSWPRGRMLGGTGSINFNIHMFGSPQDFQVWEQEYGAEGWDFQQMKKYANKAECRRLRPKIFKEQCSNEQVEKGRKGCNSSNKEESKTGSTHVRQHQDAVQCYHPALRVHTSDSILSDTFLDAGRELGLPVGNLNDDIDHGVMAAETMVYKGQRWSTAAGYLRPALGRPNLHVLLHSHVNKILWEGKRAVGVEFTHWDNPHINKSVYARGEVILSAGAVNTPHILMHSGVGPSTLLHKFNIPVVSVLEGVGGNLQDHLCMPVYVSLEEDVSLNPVKLRTVSNIWNYFVNGGKGDLGRAAIEGIGVMRLAHQQPEVGLILFNMGAVDKHLYASVENMELDYFETLCTNMDNQSAAGFMFMALCLHPKSRGRIDIVSSDPRHPPSINPDYLRHPYDMTCMRDAYKFAVRMVRTNAFQSLGASVHLPRFPECLVRTSQGGGVDDARALYQEYVSCIIRVAAISGHHPLGTARIGRRGDPLAVVDPQLKKLGVTNLNWRARRFVPLQQTVRRSSSY
ncbi:L-sorbose 1-dehydrogenase-like isoform X2 [Cherax quadricarinatus]